MSYLCICALHDLENTPSRIPVHTGLLRGEMALHSGCTGGDLGTGDSGCHSLKDKKLTGIFCFPWGSGPLGESSIRYQAAVQSSLLKNRPMRNEGARFCLCHFTYHLGDLGFVPQSLWPLRSPPTDRSKNAVPPISLSKDPVKYWKMLDKL